jgi:uncharacterized protein (TIGR00255 family)
MLSMTGYGKGEVEWDEGKLIIELRSLNSKSFDLRCRLPQLFKEQEMAFRRRVREVGLRGKFDLSLSLQGVQEEVFEIDAQQFRRYFLQVQDLGHELNFDTTSAAAALLSIPDIRVSATESLSEDKIQLSFQALDQALEQLEAFRAEEGSMTANDLRGHVTDILDLLQEIEPYEKDRNEEVRERLGQKLTERFDRGDIDPHRFEEEVLYYLDKLDISEEKVRLEQHCKYFLEQFDLEEREVGKKLNFISQEMGREINTLGSKAHFFEIQQRVVQMKDRLEKVKEQVANIV